MKDQIAEILGKEEGKEFWDWAFQESADLPIPKKMEAWNKHHGHMLKLDPRNNPYEDIPKMIEVWKKSKKL